jgi:hypothetical protein
MENIMHSVHLNECRKGLIDFRPSGFDITSDENLKGIKTRSKRRGVGLTNLIYTMWILVVKTLYLRPRGEKQMFFDLFSAFQYHTTPAAGPEGKGHSRKPKHTIKWIVIYLTNRLQFVRLNQEVVSCVMRGYCYSQLCDERRLL